MSSSNGVASAPPLVLPADAATPTDPVDTPTPAGEDEPNDVPAPQGATKSRRDRALAQAAKAAEPPRFTPDAGAKWIPTVGGEACVCNSRPNNKGESFLYIVHRVRGRETAIPYAVVCDLEDAGQL